ncbi:MAG: GvpL/GvpF family gas vesicle protein [Candidatus Bathyarchaeia archaeon]|jgi:DnaJ-domain-containing protein 1
MGKYLYGIINSENRQSFGNIGLDNGEVYSVQFEDVGAVVSDIPENREVGIAEVKIHEATLRKIMETHAVIPMNFGIIAKDEAETKKVLKQARMKLKKTLEKVDNKLQINVKISWDKVVLADILKESGEIRKLTREAKEKADQSLMIELGRKVKLVLDKWKSEYVEDVKSSLKSLSDELDENKVTDQNTLMHAAFLVNKKREQEFYSKLEELEKKYERKLEFLAVGPLPPYNFTKVGVTRINFDDVEAARKALGLSHEVSISEISSAYNMLVRRYHPDLHLGDPHAEEKFKEIKSAYSLLTKYCEHYLCSLQKTVVEETILVEEKGS